MCPIHVWQGDLKVYGHFLFGACAQSWPNHMVTWPTLF